MITVYDCQQYVEDCGSGAAMFLAVHKGKLGYTFDVARPFDHSNPPIIGLNHDAAEFCEALRISSGVNRGEKIPTVSFCAFELLRRAVNGKQGFARLSDGSSYSVELETTMEHR